MEFCYLRYKKITFLSSDRFGEKPLYYFIDHDNFIFGSEIKFIKSRLQKHFKINEDKINNFLNFAYKSLYKNNDHF